VVKIVDLVVSRIDTTATTVDVGTYLPIVLEVSNLGSSAVGSSNTSVFLSNDPEVTTEDIKLNRYWTGRISAGGNYLKEFDTYISTHIAPGTYYLGAIADVEEQHLETDETNNSLSTQQVEVR
jgi:subtilase family serine protease